MFVNCLFFVSLFPSLIKRDIVDIDNLVLRASTSVDAKSSKIQKSLHFTHFDQKNTHISGCKIVHKSTIDQIMPPCLSLSHASLSLLEFNILIIFSLSLSLVALTLTSLSLFLIWSNHASTAADHQTIAANQIIKPSPPIATTTDLSPIATKPDLSPITTKASPIADCRACLISGFWVGWVMIWLSDWMGFRLIGFQIEWVGFPWWCWFGWWWWWLGVLWLLVVSGLWERGVVREGIIKKL